MKTHEIIPDQLSPQRKIAPAMADVRYKASNVEGFGILHRHADKNLKIDRFALSVVREVISRSMNPATDSDESLVNVPYWMAQRSNFDQACWLGGAMLIGGKDIGIANLGKANSIVAQLPTFVERLAINHFGSLIIAEPDATNRDSSVENIDMVRRIVSVLDDKPVFSVSAEGLKLVGPAPIPSAVVA
jgi:hypothetical protein